jgi:hypothetical protein
MKFLKIEGFLAQSGFYNLINTVTYFYFDYKRVVIEDVLLVNTFSTVTSGFYKILSLKSLRMDIYLA